MSEWRFYWKHDECGYVGGKECLDYAFGHEPCPKCGIISNNHLGWEKKVGRSVTSFFGSHMEWMIHTEIL